MIEADAVCKREAFRPSLDEILISSSFLGIPWDDGKTIFDSELYERTFDE